MISVLSFHVNSDRHAKKKKKHDPDDDENDEASSTNNPNPHTHHKKKKSTTTQRHGAAFSFLSQLLQKNRRRSPGLFVHTRKHGSGTVEDHEKRRSRRTTAATAII